MLLQGFKITFYGCNHILKNLCQTTVPEQLNSARLRLKLKKNNDKMLLLG